MTKEGKIVTFHDLLVMTCNDFVFKCGSLDALICPLLVGAETPGESRSNKATFSYMHPESIFVVYNK